MAETISLAKQIIINSPIRRVWQALTYPDQMPEWMAEPEMQLSVTTDWVIGHPIIIRGLNPLPFENTGKIIEFRPENILTYSHLSSISELADISDNYTILEFELMALNEQQTQLLLTLSNFPTAVIRKHFDLYWNGTLPLLKEFAEQTAKV
ncbi:SRPBCC family protein [Pedobacter zeae]|uniref:Uncharacterized protein YndB with AHSA1/START domain n=2 Tax=Pedobacter zeae TaxID=1737356 RepID=A0A7W6KCY4_9SPHI|nr:SRPBCC domain-containing protein [Pedobacter zeae]MBB4108586.1 uncharacterized protein YndB with AHSA1/START domain [Pedobacter zeae]